jgi:hypothetical protein
MRLCLVGDVCYLIAATNELVLSYSSTLMELGRDEIRLLVDLPLSPACSQVARSLSAWMQNVGA